MDRVLEGVRQGLMVLGLLRDGVPSPRTPRRSLVGLAILLGTALGFGVLALAGVELQAAFVLLGAFFMGIVGVIGHGRGRSGG
jgi:hypothetical protein